MIAYHDKLITVKRLLELIKTTILGHFFEKKKKKTKKKKKKKRKEKRDISTLKQK